MSNDLFIDLFVLITYAILVTFALMYLLFLAFLKKTMAEQGVMMADMFRDDDAQKTTDIVDQHFASTPVGIPPSLGRN